MVHAAPHVTRAEPLVQGGGQEGHIEGEDSGRDTSHSQIDENALQESRCVEKVATMYRLVRLDFTAEMDQYAF